MKNVITKRELGEIDRQLVLADQLRGCLEHIAVNVEKMLDVEAWDATARSAIAGYVCQRNSGSVDQLLSELGIEVKTQGGE